MLTAKKFPVERSLRSAARGIFRDLAQLRFFGGLLLICILLATWGTHRRNRAWQTSGTLWADILKKVNAEKIIDPVTGNEVPRFKRGRIYNNLGLSLFREGREELLAREKLRKLSARIARLKPQAAKTALSKLSAARKNLQVVSQGKNPLRLAELCYARSLYHRPNWFISRLNYALIFKLRRQRFARDNRQWFVWLSREEGELRLAISFYQNDPKALRYFGDCLLELGEYWLRKKEFAKSLENFEEADTVCRRAFALILRGVPDIDGALGACRKLILSAASGKSRSYASTGEYEKAANALAEHLDKLLPSESAAMKKRIERLRRHRTPKKSRPSTAIPPPR